MRIPHAARSLADDLGTRYKNVKFEAAGDPDGFGVVRTVRYAGASGKFLGKLIAEVDDPRIESYEVKGDSTLVTFTHRTIADERHPFPLAAAELWLTMQSEDGGQPSE